MLSLFRHATRSAARPALLARYSTDPFPDTSAMDEAKSLLEEAAESQDRELAGGGDYSAVRLTRQTMKFKNFPRDGYAVKPHDFTYKARINAAPTYQTHRAKQGPPSSVARLNDVFHRLDIDPLDLAMEPNIISYYVTEMGKVYGRNHTGLTSKSQRRLGKAIRRAKMMGVIPILSRSPYFFYTYNK